MKLSNYSLKALSLVAGLAFVGTACSDDDEVAPAASNDPTIDGTTYTLAAGGIRDYGAVNYVDDAAATHWNYDFYLTDGTIDWAGNGVEGAAIVLYAELLSPGTTEFTTGTFTFQDSPTTASVDGAFYYSGAYVEVDLDGDGEVGGVADGDYGVTSGTVTVSGTFPDYTVTFDVVLETVGAITATYTGTFDYIDRR